jgi:hypothetical protein
MYNVLVFSSDNPDHRQMRVASSLFIGAIREPFHAIITAVSRVSPHPPFVTPSWQLPLNQTSQGLANFAPIAAVLILRFGFRTVTPAG